VPYLRMSTVLCIAVPLGGLSVGGCQLEQAVQQRPVRVACPQGKTPVRPMALRWPDVSAQRVQDSWLFSALRHRVGSNPTARRALIYEALSFLRSRDPDVLKALAALYRASGRFGLARHTYRRLLALELTKGQRAWVKTQIETLSRASPSAAPLPHDQEVTNHSDLARRAIALAKRAEQKRFYALAGRYWMVALILDVSRIGGLWQLRALGSRIRAVPLTFYQQLLRLRPGEYLATLVRAALKKLPTTARTHVRSGTLVFRIAQPATLYVNGDRWTARGVTRTHGALPAGTYDLVVVCQACSRRRIQFSIQAGRTSRVHYDLACLRLRLVPPATELHVDGRPVRLEKKPICFASGRRRIQVHNPTYRLALDTTQEIRRGDVVTLQRWFGVGATQMATIVRHYRKHQRFLRKIKPSMRQSSLSIEAGEDGNDDAGQSPPARLLPTVLFSRRAGASPSLRLAQRSAVQLVRGALQLMARRRFQAAYRHIVRAVRLRPRDPAIRRYLGMLQVRVGDFSGAIRTVRWMEQHVGEAAAERLRSAQKRAMP